MRAFILFTFLLALAFPCFSQGNDDIKNGPRPPYGVIKKDPAGGKETKKPNDSLDILIQILSGEVLVDEHPRPEPDTCVEEPVEEPNRRRPVTKEGIMLEVYRINAERRKKASENK